MSSYESVFGHTYKPYYRYPFYAQSSLRHTPRDWFLQ